MLNFYRSSFVAQFFVNTFYVALITPLTCFSIKILLLKCNNLAPCSENLKETITILPCYINIFCSKDYKLYFQESTSSKCHEFNKLQPCDRRTGELRNVQSQNQGRIIPSLTYHSKFRGHSLMTSPKIEPVAFFAKMSLASPLVYVTNQLLIL